VGVAWAIFGAGQLLSVDLTGLGIYPRRFLGLWGVGLAPFIHGDLSHLVSNSVPFIILFTSINFFYQRVAARVVPIIYLGTGLAVWLLARPSYHVGASGVIYGLAAFLFFSGVFRGSLPALVIAVAVAVLYGGMVEGIFPREEGVSWESHLAGAVLGASVAYQTRRQLEPEEQASSLPAPHLTDGPPEGYRNLAGRRFKYEYRERPKGD
jgi:membrane associated rhomboid family serine protease